MSWYLANTAGVGDEFASGASFDALRDAAAPYASLMQFLDDGITKNVELCETQLRQLAERTDDGNAKRVALNLADLMKGQDLVAITQGFGAAETPDAEPATESLREAEVPKHQAERDKSLRGASRKIKKLVRNRFRAQRKAVLDSHALANLKAVLERTHVISEAASDSDRAKLETEIASSLGPQVYMQPVTNAEQEKFTGAIKAAIDSGGEAVADMLSTSAPQTTESFVAEYLKDGGFSRLTGDLDKTTVDNLARAVADAYESGADFDGVVQAVKDSFADAMDNRARMIAQNELQDAWNQSVLNLGREAGATQKSWEVDPGACPICLENVLDGSIDLETDFSSGDDAPPAHVNCNCSVLVHA